MLGGKVEVPSLNGKTEVKVTILGGIVHAFTLPVSFYLLLVLLVYNCIYAWSLLQFKFKMPGNNLNLFLTGTCLHAHGNLCFVETYLRVLIEWIGFQV
jgi:hypothetical protein